MPKLRAITTTERIPRNGEREIKQQCSMTERQNTTNLLSNRPPCLPLNGEVHLEKHPGCRRRIPKGQRWFNSSDGQGCFACVHRLLRGKFTRPVDCRFGVSEFLVRSFLFKTSKFIWMLMEGPFFSWSAVWFRYLRWFRT